MMDDYAKRPKQPVIPLRLEALRKRVIDFLFIVLIAAFATVLATCWVVWSMRDWK